MKESTSRITQQGQLSWLCCIIIITTLHCRLHFIEKDRERERERKEKRKERRRCRVSLRRES